MHPIRHTWCADLTCYIRRLVNHYVSRTCLDRYISLLVLLLLLLQSKDLPHEPNRGSNHNAVVASNNKSEGIARKNPQSRPRGLIGNFMPSVPRPHSIAKAGHSHKSHFMVQYPPGDSCPAKRFNALHWSTCTACQESRLQPLLVTVHCLSRPLLVQAHCLSRL